MQKRCFFAWTVWAILLCCDNVLAKVYLLPDYAQRQVNSHRINIPGQNNTSASPNGGRVFDCNDYGMKDISELGDMRDCVDYYYGIRTCCKAWKCKAEYKYTENDCRDQGKVPAGDACDDKYQACECDTTTYPYTSSNDCHALLGNSCIDGNITYYQECYNVTELGCDETLGCKTYDTIATDVCIACNEEATCDPGYHVNPAMRTVCVPNTCPESYATSADGCGTSESPFKWELGYETNGQSGTEICHLCQQACDASAGYTDIETYWCNSAPITDCEELGYHEASINYSGQRTYACLFGQTAIICPFDDRYYVCVGEGKLQMTPME